MITDIMIDTEFLSLKYDSYILSIGAVAWDSEDEEFYVLDRLHEFPSMRSQQKYSPTIDGDTLMWWLGQSQEPRESIINGQKKACKAIKDTLLNLGYFIQDKGPGIQRIWSHGAVCDLPLLKHWYDKLGMVTPWQYQQPRDTRTLFEAVNCTPERNYTGGVAHDALADAIAQAEQVHTAWKLRRV